MSHKLIPLEEQAKIIERVKAGASINKVRNDTGYGVTILKRICTQHSVPIKNNQIPTGRIGVNFEKTFSENSTAGNMHINACIRAHNLIPHDKCYHCGLSDWINGPLKLQLDHINGNGQDHRLDNLRYLCPNCHSQTPTYCKSNNQGKKKVSDKELTAALKDEPNIRKALIKVGLTAKGGNYVRANKILSTF